MPGALRYAIFNSVHVVTYFLMLIRLLLLLLQVRAPPFTRRWLLNMHLPRNKGKRAKSKEEESWGDVQLDMVRHRWLLFRISGP